MYDFLEINDCNSAYFKEVIEIYNNSFPENERNPLEKIVKRITQKSSKLYGYILDNHIIAFAFLAELENNYILLDYFAVKKEYQGKGIGSRVIDLIISSLKNKTLILEVENPEFGEDWILRKKRVEFYQKKGIKILKNVKYILPPLDNSDNYTEMILMIFNNNQDDIKISNSEIINLISDIYSKIYNRQNNDIYLIQIIRTIGNIKEISF